MIVSKNLNINNVVNKLMNIWKDDPINSFKNLLKNLDNDIIIFDNDTQNLINSSFMNIVKGDKINTTIEFLDDDINQNLPSGKEIKNISDNSNSSDNDSDTEENIINISFTKDILPYIIPLVLF